MTIETIQELEHTADWSIRVRGRDLKELFANAARGMFGLMVDLETVSPQALAVERQIELHEFDTESLLVAWLSELLWLNEESDAVFVRYEIAALTPTRLEAAVWGGPATVHKGHIKAVTFHDLKIVQTEDGYEVTLVFDV